MRVRKCEKCGSMAEVTRPKPKLQVVFCPRCKHKTVKHIVRKGPGG